MIRLLSPLDCAKAPAVELKQVCSVVLWLQRSSSLKADTSANPFAIAGSHGNKFHHVERNIFVPARAERDVWTFVHLIFSIHHDSQLDRVAGARGQATRRIRQQIIAKEHSRSGATDRAANVEESPDSRD